jgi:hypothetical protein
MSWRPKLNVNTAHHKEPDTRFTKADIEHILEKVDSAERSELKSILDTVRKSLLNEYYNQELDILEGSLKSKKEITLVRIRYVIKSLLDKMTPTGAFRFHSTQFHAFSTNGQRKTRKNIVKVNGKKGTKRVEIYNSVKRKTYRNSKKLTAKEIANIRRGKFMPGLFKAL